MTRAPVEDLIVRCAECDSSYRLPVVLLGERGGRVRCRACGARFDVLWDPRLEDARRIAEAVVERLAPHVPRLASAQDRGRLFADAGEPLLDAFADYRRRAGDEAPAAPFREALRARWGIEVPGAEPISQGEGREATDEARLARATGPNAP